MNLEIKTKGGAASGGGVSLLNCGLSPIINRDVKGERLMNIKKYIPILIILLLAGCGKAETDSNTAISLSKEGLSLMAQSRQEGIDASEKSKLESEGKEKIRQSEEIYQRLIAQYPENGLYLNSYGWLQMKTGDLEFRGQLP